MTFVWLIPFIAACVLSLSHRRSEIFIARFSRLTAGLYLLGVIALTAIWLFGGTPLTISYHPYLHLLHNSIDYDLRFDGVSATFLGVTAGCAMVVIRFSQVYLHREAGYARFFSLIFLLVSGMSILALADSLTFFFAGWELVGFASFFLVAFYRTRAASVSNALKVFAVYRIGDLGLLFSIVILHLAAPASEHLTFSTLQQAISGLHEHHEFLVAILALGIVIAAMAKSAQIPFTFWLPKAMEGPTPSSAIFYGALAVHGGVLLLLRTAPVWREFFLVQVAVGVVGFTTMLVATLCGRVQSSIKGQLAYASATQVGIMFIELACGFHRLVLFHFVTHALFRSFQILISPSIITAFMRMQLADSGNLKFSKWSVEKLLPRRLLSTFFVIGIQDGYLEQFWRRVVIRPMYFFFVYDSAVMLTWRSLTAIAFAVMTYLYSGSRLMAVVALLTFIQVQLAIRSCFFAGGIGRLANQIFSVYVLAGCISFCMTQNATALWAVIGGIFPFWLAIQWLVRKNGIDSLELRNYHGIFEKNPRLMWALVILFCGLIGMPPFPSFFAEDVILEPMIHSFSFASVAFGLALGLCGIAVFRAIALLGMGSLRP